uniref:C2 tensin-type domain-containing protein n=1 Tax=Kalanchoe fedtschenkoi TaxID=63787 RepID=A0A7N0V7I4_KALFE
MARTGLMISCLLLYLKFFPTAEESIDYYNQKRCVDGKGLALPSQIRYVKYYERTLTYFNGEVQPGRRCMLRGFRLHKCPYWVRPSITVSDFNGVLFTTKKHPRTKDLSPDELWFAAPKKGIMVFALPGEPGLTELAGDFKVHFHDRQGDFYCWLNTTMMENRKILSTSDLDGFDKRKLPSPGFQVEVVLVDYESRPVPTPATPTTPAASKPDESSAASSPAQDSAATTTTTKAPGTREKDDVFSDDEGSSRGKREKSTPTATATTPSDLETKPSSDSVATVTQKTEQVSITDAKQPATETRSQAPVGTNPAAPANPEVSEFKAMAADASVFTFGDDEDYESD